MNKFRVIAADPGWAFGDKLGRRGAAAKYKTTMNVWEICAMPLPVVPARNAFLFLWRASAMVEEAYRVGRAWGFEPKTEIVWNKLTKTGKPWFGMGHYTRAAHETCIVFTRGAANVRTHSIRSTFSAPVPVDAKGKYIHSAKPEKFYDIVEELAKGPYAELFARRHRPGWACFGDELPAR